MPLKIAYIAAGAAGMYCGNCLHDNTLAQALLDLGHDILLIPTYTPLKTDEEDVSLQRVFFGGINVYLQQKSALFRHTPWFMDRLLDSPKLIEYLAKRSLSTKPEDLGELTISMLQGDEGRQKKELDKLIHWLQHDVKPDVVHLSNALLIGMARQMRQRLKVPVVCTISGEDMYLDGLKEPFKEQAHKILRERASDVHAFVSLNRYYADVMAGRLGVDQEAIHIIEHGLNLEGHGQRRGSGEGFTFGYLARVTPEKGLHVAVEALRQLAADSSLPQVRLRAAGYLGPAYQHYLDEIQRNVQAWGLEDRFEYLGEIDRAEKIEFLQSLDCLTMPAVYPESKALPVLEAWANEVPVVVPNNGTFPELIEAGAGGLLYDPDDPQALAAALRKFIADPQLAARCGTMGRTAMQERFNARQMAERTADLYQRLVNSAVSNPSDLDSAPAPAP